MTVPDKTKTMEDTRLGDLTMGELRHLIRQEMQTADETKLGDLTVSEFKKMMRDMLQEVVWEIEQHLPDPDEGLELKSEVAEQLQKFLDEKPKGRPAEDIMRELGLLDE